MFLSWWVVVVVAVVSGWLRRVFVGENGMEVKPKQCNYAARLRLALFRSRGLAPFFLMVGVSGHACKDAKSPRFTNHLNHHHGVVDTGSKRQPHCRKRSSRERTRAGCRLRCRTQEERRQKGHWCGSNEFRDSPLPHSGFQTNILSVPQLDATEEQAEDAEGDAGNDDDDEGEGEGDATTVKSKQSILLERRNNTWLSTPTPLTFHTFF